MPLLVTRSQTMKTVGDICIFDLRLCLMAKEVETGRSAATLWLAVLVSHCTGRASNAVLCLCWHQVHCNSAGTCVSLSDLHITRYRIATTPHSRLVREDNISKELIQEVSSVPHIAPYIPSEAASLKLVLTFRIKHLFSLPCNQHNLITFPELMSPITY